MANMDNSRVKHTEEIRMKAMGGMGCLVMNVIATLAALAAFVIGIIIAADPEMAVERVGTDNMTLAVLMIVVGSVYGFIVGPTLFAGLKVIKPNEALVLTLFGKYVGTLKGEGFYWVNPFCAGVNPAAEQKAEQASAGGAASALAALGAGNVNVNVSAGNKKLSLKDMTLSNERQKINDKLGNPIIIGIIVIWRIKNTAKAVFNVDNYKEFLNTQCDSALRNIVRLYPYDSQDPNGEASLRGSSVEVAEKLKAEIQEKVEIAGLEIVEARITNLAYSEEIAAAMLQRQQASAIVDARNMIVEGAVGMVKMALAKLNEENVVDLDEERKAAMVSNLLVVLCGNKDAQPIVNSGTLYN